MNPIGFTSVTFRNLKIEECIRLANETGCNGIEWGSDVHILIEDAAAANKAQQLCSQAKLQIYSYGTYYKLCQGLDPVRDFLPLLHQAERLKTTTLRVWAGRTASRDAEEELYDQMAREAQMMADLAADKGMTLAFEYHRRSLTDTAESCLKLLKLIDRKNVKTYWQPNPEISTAENLRELRLVKDYVVRAHVFHWDKENERYPLSDGITAWKQYINEMKEIPLLLEFVKEDSITQFKRDLDTLKNLVVR